MRGWARVVGDVNVSVRRGAWYEVMRLTPEAAVLEVHHRAVSIPRSAVQVAVVRPRQWSIVERPYDAVDLPISWGSRYGVCPACSHRVALKPQATDMSCTRCGGVFALRA